MTDIICYICGNKFATKSIGIHVKTCTKSWNLKEAKLPASKRRPLPECPEGYDVDKIKNGDFTAKEI